MSSDNPRDHNNADFQLANVFNVKDKVALITGGGSGIGLMATQALAVNGAKVYITGRTEEKLNTVAQTFGQGISGQILPITCDVTKKDQIAQLYDQISSKENHLDILINNAGIAKGTFQWEAETAEEMKKNLFDHENATFENWNEIYQTNVAQCWFMSTAFLPMLQKASDTRHGSSGTIINITSISGQVKTTQHHPQYNASKAAAIHVNRMLANEIQANGLKIRVNNIAPGVFPSEMTAEESAANQKSHIPKENFETKVPAGRPGKDQDMAGAVLFVATNQYLNGETITVDGGYTLRTGR